MGAFVITGHQAFGAPVPAFFFGIHVPLPVRYFLLGYLILLGQVFFIVTETLSARVPLRCFPVLVNVVQHLVNFGRNAGLGRDRCPGGITG